MSIYAILASKPHNPHYLNRYIRFIESCKQVNENYTGYTEKHHICPRSLFPEYKSFTEHAWNKVLLTARQHFIAHWILWKAYPDDHSMLFAFHRMNSKNCIKLNSRTYGTLREEYSKATSILAKERVENGTHNFLGGEISRKSNRKRIENGTHPFLGGELQRKNNRKRVEDGTHHLLGGKISREIARKRVENGTHNFLDSEYQRNVQKRRIEDGSHNLLGGVTCYDRDSNVVQIPKEVYHNQRGPKEEWEFVHVSSKEGKRRKLLSIKVKI